jgi:hypothetical protein
MRSPRRGSAAVARRSRQAMPESADAVRKALHRCISRLDHGLALARIAAEGAEPDAGAKYLVDALKILRPELRLLRRAARSTS